MMQKYHYDHMLQLLFIVQVPKSCPTLRPHGLQHSRLLHPGVCSNSCPLSQWGHPTISSSVTPFSSCPQSFLASEFFPMSWLFTSGQSIGASTSASVLPKDIQGWFPLGLTGLISLQSKGLSRVFSCVAVFCCSVVSNSLWPHGPHQAPPSLGFSREEYWSGLPYPPPGDLPNPGIEPRSPALQEDSLLSEPPGKPLCGYWALNMELVWLSGECNGTPLQCSCLENPMDGGAW